MPLIEAHITKVEREEGSDWGTIHTDHPEIKKMTTKVPEKITEAAHFRQTGQLVGIDYNETKKRTDDGRVYTNRYYDKAGALGTNGAQQQQIPGVDVVAPVGREDSPAKKWSIALQGGGKLAVATLPLMPVEQRDFETQKTIALAWAEFFYFTPPPSAPRHATTGAYREPEPSDAPPPYGDEDVPF